MTAATLPSLTETRSQLGAWVSKRAPRGFLFIVMMLTGISSLIHEYVYSTVFTYLLGNSMHQFALTIGIMFAAMGVGTWAQKFIKNACAEAFILVELSLAVAGGFGPVALQWAYSYMPDEFTWIKLAFTVIPGLAIGMEIPLITRINERFAKNLGENISQTWAWDYVGGFAGVLLWLWIVTKLPITVVSFWVAGCNLAVALLALGFFWKRGLLQRRTYGILLSGITVFCTAIFAYGSFNANAWGATIGQSLYDNPIEVAFNTQYQNIVLTRGDHPTDPFSHNWELWLNGNKQLSSVDEATYHEELVHPAMNLAAQAERILILGGGDGMALREVLKYEGVREVTLVDLDPGMIEFAMTNPVMRELNHDSFRDARVSSSFDDPSLNAGVIDTGDTREVLVETGRYEQVDCTELERPDGARTSNCESTPVTESVGSVNVYTIDADQFMNHDSGIWDVVIVDLPDPNSIELAKLYSVEFYTKIHDALNPSGIMVVQATSPYHAKETFLAINRTLIAAGLSTLPYHINVPSFGDWGWILGSPSLSQDALYDRANNLDSFGVETRRIDASVFRSSLVFEIGALTSVHEGISTVMDPQIFKIYVDEGWMIE